MNFNLVLRGAVILIRSFSIKPKITKYAIVNHFAISQFQIFGQFLVHTHNLLMY